VTVSFRLLNLKQRDDLNAVGWFFRREEEGLTFSPELFNHDRWGQCNEAIVAEEDGAIVGVITLAPKGIGRVTLPTLDTLYVTKGHRSKGLGSTLFEHGIRRLIDLGGDGKIFCQLQSSIMVRVVAKLPTELRERLQVQEAFRAGDLADDFDFLEGQSPS
jgi:GNAT superfamily N-acetyltransferase